MNFNKYKKSLVIFSFFGLTSLSVLGQELVRPVITGAPFLQIVPDARSGGMGEIGVASFGDAYSQYHNPAKYLFMEEGAHGIGLSYIPRFLGYADDIFFANATYYKRINKRSSLSGSLSYFSFGNVELEEQNGNEIIQQGSFVPNELALEGSYSLKLNKNFGMSVSAKYIRSDITDNQMNSTVQLKTGNAVAADVSGYYTSAPVNHQNKWTAGFSLKNVGSKLEYSNESGFKYPLPTSLKIGGGYHISSGKNDYFSFYGEALKYLVPASDDSRNLPDESVIRGMFSSFTDAPDGFSEEIKEVIFSFGSEVSFNQVVFLRAGYITQNEDKGYRNHLSVGAGIAYGQFNFDFGYQFPIATKISLRQTEIFKFSLSFNLKVASQTPNNSQNVEVN